MNISEEPPTAAELSSENLVPPANHLDKHEPDSDAIKMFCGQIPRHMHESELRDMFEQFGPVFQLNVLRDKQTGESKGCCFVTFYSRKAALDAQNALHNLRTLTGSHHPIQMKPADAENRNERKLFIGMISKNFDEPNIRGLFQSYGAIEDCTILRDVNGKSRGCAFITFQKRQCAVNAIKSMHQSQTMEGCSSPLVVKFADTPKDKETKKIQQQFTNQNPNLMQQMASGNTMASQQPMNPASFMPDLGNLVILQQMLKNYGFVGNNGNTVNLAAFNNLLQMFTNSMNLNGAKLPLLVPPNSSSNLTLTSSHGSNQSLNMQEQQQQQQPPHPLNSPRTPLSPGSTATTYNNESALFMCGSGTYNNLVPNPNNIGVHHSQNGNAAGHLATPNNSHYPPLYGNSASALPTSGADTHHNLQNLVALSQMNNGASFPVFPSPSYLSPQVAGKHTEGPDGANLFIYHLPQEYGDTDLVQAFAPFGPIISAKVFVDKTTNRSKCFGFVSYDNPNSAQSAINQMNGYQIGMKRLKVQLKKLRNDPVTPVVPPNVTPTPTTVSISPSNSNEPSTPLSQNYSY